MGGIKRRNLGKEVYYRVLSVMFFIGVWELIALLPSAGALPAPHTVLIEFIDLSVRGLYGVTLWEHTLASIMRVLIGFFYAFIIGVPLGLVTAFYKPAGRLLGPIIDLLRPIPPLAWIPFSIMMFGLTVMSHIFVIFTGAFFPIFQNTYDAVKNVKKVYIEVAQTMGADKKKILYDIILPASAPSILAGAKISLGVAWMCVIAAEMIGISSNTGIGYFIMEMQGIGRYSAMIAGMIMIGAVGVLNSVVMDLISEKILKWRE